VIGKTGPQGEKGKDGTRGPIGKIGPRGFKGNTGAKGSTGRRGATGRGGATGQRGPKGETGPEPRIYLGTVTTIKADEKPRVRIAKTGAASYRIDYWLPEGVSMEIDGALNLVDCEGNKTAIPFKDLSEFGDAVGKGLENLMSRPCEVNVSISDSWEIRKEKNVGQLHIVCKKPGDKTSFRRNFSIPHSRITTEAEAKAIFTNRRRYQRGSHLTRLILRDNSSIKLCVEDEFTGQSLMDWLVNNCIDTSWIETSSGKYRHTKNVKQEIISCEVELYRVAYYPTGARGEMPAWAFVIPE
jgi:hypothetical protein